MLRTQGLNGRFSIAFVADEPVQDEDMLALEGEIRLGDHTERFLAALGVWSREQYEIHWRDAARRLVDGAPATAFVTSAFRFWWPMWRSGEYLAVHEELISVAGIGHRVDPARLFDSIRPYRGSRTEEGHAISEWYLEVKDIEAWLSSLPLPPRPQ